MTCNNHFEVWSGESGTLILKGKRQVHKTKTQEQIQAMIEEFKKDSKTRLSDKDRDVQALLRAQKDEHNHRWKFEAAKVEKSQSGWTETIFVISSREMTPQEQITELRSLLQDVEEANRANKNQLSRCRQELKDEKEENKLLRRQVAEEQRKADELSRQVLEEKEDNKVLRQKMWEAKKQHDRELAAEQKRADELDGLLEAEKRETTRLRDELWMMKKNRTIAVELPAAEPARKREERRKEEDPQRRPGANEGRRRRN